jgi:hypothetical protein
MTEHQLQRHVIDQARSLGWGVTLSARKAMLEEAAAYRVEPPPLDGLIFHPQYSLGSEPGWPDLVLIRRRDRRLIFAELKSEKGQLSARQAEVLELLRSLVWVDPTKSAVLAPYADLLPRIEIYVWRPSDMAEIERVLS